MANSVIPSRFVPASGGGGGSSVDPLQYRTLSVLANYASNSFFSVGTSITQTGTNTNRFHIGASTFFTRMVRQGIASAASAGSMARLIINQASIYPVYGIENLSELGVSDAAAVATTRSFYGYISGAPIAATATPNTLVNCFGVGHDSGDTNLSLYYNDGSGTPTKTDLGSSFPASSRSVDVYRLSLVCAVGGASWTYTLTNATTGQISTATVTTNIPSATTDLTFYFWRSNATTAASVAIDVMFANERTPY